MGSTYSNLLFHVVFGTKHRDITITDNQLPDLHAYMASLLKLEEAAPIKVGGMPDHAHLFFQMKPSACLAEVVRSVKANSSKWVRRTFADDFGWQEGYGAFSVSQSQTIHLKNYIVNQKQHHVKLSFKDELKLFYQKHQIEFEAYYI